MPRSHKIQFRLNNSRSLNVRRSGMKQQLRSSIANTITALSALCVFAAQTRAADKVDFSKDVKPVLQMYCVACHNAKHAHENGEFDISTKAAAFKGGDKGEDDIVAGSPEKSRLYKYI